MSKLKRIIEAKRSIIVAADVDSLSKLTDLAMAVKGVEGISAFKLGIGLGLEGLGMSVDIVKRILGDDFPVIYDHQKAGNDIPNMGKVFVRKLKDAGVTAAILFPFAGPVTQEAWIKACQDADLDVLVGGIMTHEGFLESEGGYIANDAPARIYHLACQLGVRHFVVPGTKLDWVKNIRADLIETLGEGNFALYAPGFITQKGDLSECGKVAGEEWHAIVGSAIYGQITKEEMRQAAVLVTRQIVVG